MKTKSFRKVLTTSATCIVLATSFAGGTLRVWAEQLYYGWNDGTRQSSPYFLYVTPTEKPIRSTDIKYIVYCFNRNKKWPDNWEEVNIRKNPTELKLPIYDKKEGTNELFVHEASKPRATVNMDKSLVAILSKGFPNNTELLSKYMLTNESARIVTQLAIWYFSDSENNPESVITQSLNQKELEALKYLIEVGKNPQLSEAEQKQTLDIYVYNSGGYYGRDYQNLLGSSLIPKKEKPSSESVTQSNLILLEQENHSGTISGGSGNTETEENTPHLMGIGGGLAGESGENTPKPGETGGHSPIVEENYGSTEGYHGQSGILEETEDTNPPGITLGGSGNVETHEDTRDPHLMGLGGGLAGESGETTPKPGETGGHGPIIETTEDTQHGMSGNSGGAVESEDTKKPEVLIGGQGQTIETTEDTQKGMSGQSGGTIESEDTKKPEVMIGGQGQIIDFSENTQSGMSGQSGDTTVIEDTKKSEIIIGGQGQIIDFSEDTQPGMSGQSGGTTIVEDTKKPTPKPKPAPAPIVNDEKPNKGTQLPQTNDMKQLTLSIIGAMSMLLVLCLSLFKRPSKKD
ncbi:TPA: fibronectin binding protein [Streptococcus equi subsp. zooepidemicus]|uniref:thioester-forming surface-anchored protein n=1 Tax=Streptococcus equi TaxID=1336 RepID=UPI001E363942|nr:thioester-forming surface-anchored protein [Streptococcus equi]MCD3417317.1 fibronectin binding protein [Streptococcus equi subsp. zooepidemicus]HEK9988915.1 fibronectin binding protein [Streptococcus equi subsp. zooepidemicus]HEL0644435.1 fibronectin binding protein [Streptococcus equi subsp. zooepidemicus]HEL1077112.1 fibronectin binding protein [Streptococcus equi subsp. zooepidemicus]HEL1125209.1 fibronectin binding protein [Streptococcus equi subsp. zooepidemicus]